MDSFDYDSPAEVFASAGRSPRRQRILYKRFGTAAEAIRFTIEELAPELVAGTILEVCEERYDSHQILQLYNRDDYPLARRASS